jgi:hypothetical protein
MAGYGSKEARINQERRARISQCGGCGTEVGETELLCEECRRQPDGGEMPPESSERSL